MSFNLNCSITPRIGQFTCLLPTINLDTQQPENCTINNTAPLICKLVDGLRCLDNTGLNDTHFITQQPCQFTTGHSLQVTLLLAVFLGMFGADRFYLGYYAIGLLKFCTFGFMLFGQLVDVILIVTQVLRPSDGSHYVIDYFGPKMNITTSLTAILPPTTTTILTTTSNLIS